MAPNLTYLMNKPDEEINWKKEAQMLYDYLIKLEDKKSKEVEKIMKEFSKKIDKETDPIKRKNLFQELKLKLFNLRHKDTNFERTILFILLIGKTINKFESKYEEELSNIKHLRNLLINVDSTKSSETYKTINKLIKEGQKSLEAKSGQTTRKTDLIIRNDMFRYANTERLEYFRKAGYKYKTNYMVNDERTGEDSRYFNSLKQVRKLDDDFEYEWEGEIRRFPHGPDRSNDRQILIPYIE